MTDPVQAELEKLRADFAFLEDCLGAAQRNGKTLSEAKRALVAELADLRREVKAWRGLAEYALEGPTHRRSAELPFLNIHRQWVCFSHDSKEREGKVGKGPTPQSAAIALAEQLGILPKEEA